MTAPRPTLAVVWVDNVGSDWLALYIDGAKVYEGHPPDFEDTLTILDVDVETRTFPSDRLYRIGVRGMPRELSRVAS